MKFWIFAFGVIGFIFSVRAQSVNSHHFEFSDTLETVGMEDALGISSELIQSENPFLFRASFDYARDGLSAINSNNNLSIVDHMHTVFLGGSAVIHPRVLVGITGALHYVQLSSAFVSGQFDESVWKIGDLLLHAKIRLTSDRSRINVAFRPILKLPSGSSQYLVSDDSFRWGGQVLLDTSWNRWKFFFQSGLSYASNATFLALNERKLLDVNLGAFYAINHRFGVNAEWLQSISVWELEGGQNPTQVNLGIRYDTGSTKVFLGGGLHGFDFSNSNHPYMLYAGIKQPFGAKKSSQPTTSASVVTHESMDHELAKVIETIQAMVVYFDNNRAKIKSDQY